MINHCKTNKLPAGPRLDRVQSKRIRSHHQPSSAAVFAEAAERTRRIVNNVLKVAQDRAIIAV
jgi:hypothetical protein